MNTLDGCLFRFRTIKQELGEEQGQQQQNSAEFGIITTRGIV